MYNNIINNLKTGLNKAVNHYMGELASLRVGRANPKILDTVMVNYYGNLTPLTQMANISVPEARMLLISLWDVNMIKETVKAINNANLGLNPSDDGKIIRLVMPVLTEERRFEYVKVAKKMAEDVKIVTRGLRHEAVETLKQMKKDNELTEDDLKVAEKVVQREIDNISVEIDKLFKSREKDILEI